MMQIGDTHEVVVIAVFGVWASIDERGPSVIRGYYRHKEDAQIAAKGAGWWGADGEVKPVLALEQVNGFTWGPPDTVIVVDAVTLKSINRAALRKQALAKLSADEIAALGITP